MFAFECQRLLLTTTSILLSASLLLARGQTCLSTLSQFEAGVTSDRDNVDRLTGGFYPTNRPSPLVADICYYVNAASASDVPGPREASFQVRVRAFPCTPQSHSIFVHYNVSTSSCPGTPEFVTHAATH